ncbi:hypothetical protein [Tumebacillus flagellatus]|nr:hypothetical protein [Tumebacillus flagellatus]
MKKKRTVARLSVLTAAVNRKKQPPRHERTADFVCQLGVDAR